MPILDPTPRLLSASRCRVLASAVAGLAVAAATVAAAGQAAGRDVRWRSGADPLAVLSGEQLVSQLRACADPGSPRHVLVQAGRPLTPGETAALRNAGLELLDYLGADAFFARLDPQRLDASAAAKAAPLTHVGPVDPHRKLHPLLLAGRIPPWALGSGRRDGAAQRAALTVQFFRGVNLDTQARAAVQRHGGVVRSRIGSVQALSIELPAANFQALAAEDVVQWIEPPLPALGGVNDQARSVTGADIVQSNAYGLDGDGIMVLVFDSGQAAVNHPDLAGRANAGPSDHESISTHSTHVACTIAGDGGLECGVYTGMAPAARVLSYGFSPAGGGTFLYTDPGDIEVNYTEAVELGVAIANNSIGTNLCANGFGNPEVFDCEFTGDYGVTDELIDSIVTGSLGRRLPIVWAAGNERSCNRCTNEGGADSAGFHSTAPPACVKNPIVVGAVNSNNESMTGFSSWGPCDDGRLRPDLVAPGCQGNDDFGIQSCAASGGYVSLCGTSMAAPVVTGLSTLLMQDYRLRHPGEPDLRNATLKAILLHTAADWGTPGPDYRSGYGAARVVPAVELVRSESFAQAAIGPGQVASFFVDVRPEDHALKATLAWDDPPGVPNVTPALVSDLDLRVFSPQGQQHHPWTLDPGQPGAAAVITGPDRVNNVEQVMVEDPAAGTWRVEVHAFSLPAGTQSFSLAATPQLPVCAARGAVAFDAASVPCTTDLEVRVLDCDLDQDPQAVESQQLVVSSSSEPGGEPVTLLETAPAGGVFRAHLLLDIQDASGVLQVAPGDVITATYVDADDGRGGTNVLRTATAVVDCVPPAIESLRVLEVDPPLAIIEIRSDEPTRAVINYGTACAQLTLTAEDAVLRAEHTLELNGIGPGPHVFSIQLADAAGNLLEDAGGSCLALVAPDCNGNGKSDFQEISDGSSPDCNDNQAPDECDVQQGVSLDCQADGVPDDCQADCNDNQVADDCDISDGTSPDCNDNGLPDDCEVVNFSQTYEVVYSPPLDLPRVGSVFQELQVPDSFSPGELAVTLNIEHDYLPAVRVRLLHESLDQELTIVRLIEDCTVAGENFIDTVLRDAAELPICAGQPPFTGEFQPVEPLAPFSSLDDVRGTWTLIVSSTGQGGCGRLLGWRLDFEAAASDCNANGIPDSCDLASGVLHDANGDGQPDECAPGCPAIASSVPADGAIDARQPHALDNPEPRAGWQFIQLEFDGPAQALAAGDFTVIQEGGSGPAPDVAAAAAVGQNAVEVALSAPIEPGAWTTLIHTCSDSRVRLGYLPGDVNGDGTSDPADILALIDTLNGSVPRPPHAADIDRSGLAQPQDLLRLIDLLNGAGAFESWNGRSLP